MRGMMQYRLFKGTVIVLVSIAGSAWGNGEFGSVVRYPLWGSPWIVRGYHNVQAVSCGTSYRQGDFYVKERYHAWYGSSFFQESPFNGSEGIGNGNEHAKSHRDNDFSTGDTCGKDTVAILGLRTRWRNSVSLELPWNGIVGFGVMYTCRPSSAIAIEGGGGLSLMGLKLGIRGRYCLSDIKRTSVFVGIGFFGVSGLGNSFVEEESPINNDTLRYRIRPIGFMQLSTGLDIMTTKGIFLLISTGWAVPFNEGIKDITFRGMPEEQYRLNDNDADEVIDEFEDMLDYFYRGGLVMSFSIGFSF